MASAINPSNPIFGSPTTQSVRDNFQAAHDEIGALQTAITTLLPLAGGTMTGPIVLAADPAAAMQAATRQYVDNKVAAGVVTFNTRTGAVVLQAADVTGVGGALLASPAFSGVPTTPLAAPGTNTGQIASTAFVTAAVVAGSAGVASFNTRTGAVTLQAADVTGVGGALLASPTFTGNPAAPTAPAGQSNTQIASTAFVQTAVAPNTNNVGRNLIHNPLFNVAQRGNGPWTTPVWSVDRWLSSFNLGSLSTTRITLTDADRAAIGDEAAQYAIQSVVTGGGGAAAYTQLYQSIEGVRRISGKTLTLSFWAKASAGTPKIGVSMDQNFGSGGSSSAIVTMAGIATTISTTWTRYSVTFSVPSAAGKTLGTNGDDLGALQIWFSSGTTNNSFAGGIGVQSGTFSLWGIQLEIGSVATPLEKPDPQQDLAKCQRFFCIGQVLLAGYQTAGSTVYAPASLPVTMRAAPTLASGSTANANVGAITWISGYNTVAASTPATATNPFIVNAVFTASADL